MQKELLIESFQEQRLFSYLFNDVLFCFVHMNEHIKIWLSNKFELLFVMRYLLYIVHIFIELYIMFFMHLTQEKNIYLPTLF